MRNCSLSHQAQVLLLGLQSTPAATAPLLLNFESVATTLIAVLAFKEAVDRRMWWTIELVTLASTLLSWNANDGWRISLHSFKRNTTSIVLVIRADHALGTWLTLSENHNHSLLQGARSWKESKYGMPDYAPSFD